MSSFAQTKDELASSQKQVSSLQSQKDELQMLGWLLFFLNVFFRVACSVSVFVDFIFLALLVRAFFLFQDIPVYILYIVVHCISRKITIREETFFPAFVWTTQKEAPEFSFCDFLCSCCSLFSFFFFCY